MATHELKTCIEPFEAIVLGDQRAVFLPDDRTPPFEARDTLRLREWDEERGAYTGRTISATVTDVRRAGEFGIPEGYVMMSIDAYVLYPEED